jgi:hypothetical protein
MNFALAGLVGPVAGAGLLDAPEVAPDRAVDPVGAVDPAADVVVALPDVFAPELPHPASASPASPTDQAVRQGTRRPLVSPPAPKAGRP